MKPMQPLAQIHFMPLDRTASVPIGSSLLDALRQAVKSNRATVINLMLTQELGEPFRRDAFKPPRRLLNKYRKYSAK